MFEGGERRGIAYLFLAFGVVWSSCSEGEWAESCCFFWMEAREGDVVRR